MNGWLRALRERPGLAGGVDRSGSCAAALLACGFAGVEFGTVTPLPDGAQVGVAALVQRLGDVVALPCRARIGIGIGLGAGAPPGALGAHWLAGLRSAWPVADYLVFNLSAAAYRPLLRPEHDALVAAALATLASERAWLRASTGRRVALALKLPLDAPQLSAAAQSALAAGFDAVIPVLPQHQARLDWLQDWSRALDGGAALVAVGGIRSAADVRAALQAGASGIQVHRAFVESGVACLAPLLAGLARPATIS